MFDQSRLYQDLSYEALEAMNKSSDFGKVSLFVRDITDCFTEGVFGILDGCVGSYTQLDYPCERLLDAEHYAREDALNSLQMIRTTSELAGYLIATSTNLALLQSPQAHFAVPFVIGQAASLCKIVYDERKNR